MAKKFLGLNGYQWSCILYVAVAIFSWQMKYFRHIDNNYLIFRDSYYHAREHLNLYLAYPKEYGDIYYYGPLFTLFVAPFALPSEAVGFFLWEVGNALTIVYAFSMLPLNRYRKTAMLLLCAIEFANSVFYMQFNPMITAAIIISFMLIERGKEQWATLLIVAGTMVKLYPIVGLAFFFFSKNKPRFIIWIIIWGLVLFIAPMVVSSPSFVVQSYHQWLTALGDKSAMNTGLNTSQDICVMGVVRRLTGNTHIPNLPFLLAAAVIFTLPLLRFNQFKSYQFRLQVLATSLIMVVIFSTGAEHPTFIIAVAGCILWMLIQEKPFTTANIVLIVLLLVITGLGLTDAMPKPIRQDIIAKYSIKAWPCIAVWLMISWELLFKDFTTKKSLQEEQLVLSGAYSRH